MDTKLTVRSARYVTGLVDKNQRNSAADFANVVSESTGISNISAATVPRWRSR